MTWIILFLFLVLSYLSVYRDKLESTADLKPAWCWFSGVFFSQAVMTFFRVAWHHDPAGVMVGEICTSGLVYFFVGMSILKLPSLFLGKSTSWGFNDNDVKTASYNKPPELPQSPGAKGSSSEGGGSAEIEEKPKE
ncbi:MAG: hypothetical protein P8P36_04775 [Akkermansiaceae bacterium]|nr:hypothetical protein [Akkermansiaceae bacterium]